MPIFIQKTYLNKVFSIFLILWLSTFLVLGQGVNVIKLKSELSTHNQDDTTKVELLNAITFAFRVVNPDSTKFYATKALNLAIKLGYEGGRAGALSKLAISSISLSSNKEAKYLNKQSLEIYRKIKDRKGEASLLNNMAVIYHNEASMDSAIFYYSESLKIRKEINDEHGIADCINNIGNVYLENGQFKTALEYHFQGLQIREKIYDSSGIANSHGNLAGIYFAVKNFDKALFHARSALNIQRIIGDIDGSIQSSVGIGAVFAERKEYNKAMEYFQYANKIAEKFKSSEGRITAKINMGEVYNKINKPDSALLFFNHGLNIAKQFSDQNGIAFCEIGIGNSYLLKKMFPTAISHLQTGYTISQKTKTIQHLVEATKLLAEAFEKSNQPAIAVSFFKKYIQYKDSLLNEENNRNAQEMEFNYLLEKKQNLITLLQKDQSIQKAKSDMQHLVTIALFVLVCFLVIFAFIINKFRIKEIRARELIGHQKREIENQAKNLEDLNLYKDKTFSILSHDLRNPISSLTNVVDLMDQNVINEEDFSLMRHSFRSQLKSINLLLDNTLNWSKSQMTGELNPNKNKIDISSIVERNFDLFRQNAIGKNITLSKNVDSNIPLILDENHFDIILRNIIYNGIKFTPIGGQVRVEAFQKNNIAFIKIIDTGKGMDQETIDTLFTYQNFNRKYGTNGESGAGIGLVLTHEFVQRNNGEISVTSQENIGTEFTLTFPLS
jgi:signal transduction histidine kinase